jgi:hypothetical protein
MEVRGFHGESLAERKKRGVGQFEFLTAFVTIEEIQTDPPRRSERAACGKNGRTTSARMSDSANCESSVVLTKGLRS